MIGSAMASYEMINSTYSSIVLNSSLLFDLLLDAWTFNAFGQELNYIYNNSIKAQYLNFTAYLYFNITIFWCSSNCVDCLTFNQIFWRGICSECEPGY